MSLLETALHIAEEAHKGQTMWDKKTPYIEHPKAVAEIIKRRGYDEKYQAIALLHDVIEDTPLTYKDLLKKGVPKDVTTSVNEISRGKKETYFDYIMRVRLCSICSKVKEADLEHNMSDLKEGSLKDKYRLARWVLEN